MSEQPIPPNEPEWLDEFQELANDQLDDGSSCEQIHPIVERWFSELIQGDPPPSRDSVMQAMACLATEILNSSPEYLVESVVDEVGEDELAVWIEQILLIGRAFEIALRKGELDDL
jgi:hypothetical protein